MVDLGGTDRPGELCYNFSQMSLLGWFTFLHKSLFVILTVLLFWIYLFLLILVFVLQWSFLHWEILIMLLSHFPLTFIQTQRLFLISVLTGPVFMIIWDIFEIYLRISLNLRFLYGSRLELMQQSLNINVRSSFIHLHGFQLLVLLP